MMKCRYIILILAIAIPNITHSQNYDKIYPDNLSDYFKPEEADYVGCMIEHHNSNLREEIKINNAIVDGTYDGPVANITPDSEFEDWVRYLEALSWSCMSERQNAAVLTAEKAFGVEQARNANLVDIGDKIEARYIAYFYYRFVMKPKQD